MTGEMTASEVTRTSYPLHFAIADALGGTVQPYDQYQGPYVSVGFDVRGGLGAYATAPRIPGVVRLWLVADEDGEDGEWKVYNEDNDRTSFGFLDDCTAEVFAVAAAREVLGR